MLENETRLPSTQRPRTLRLQKMEVKQLQNQYEDIESRLLTFKDLLKEKDSELSKQRTQLKLQSDKLSLLSLNNDQLKLHIQILTKYITETLKESLPQLPPLPRDNLKEIDALLTTFNREKKSKKRIRSGSQVFESSNFRADLEKIPKTQKQNFEFSGSEVLNSIVNLQDVRRAAQQAARSSGRYTIVTSNRISMFESLSLFLSLKNVVLMHKLEVFLPRVLEMLMDMMDLERVILYVCEPDHMYSLAQAGQITKQMIIMKGYFHLYLSLEKPVIITQAYEDDKFDKKYDELGQFKTNNLVCVPIKLGPETIGILECANKATDFIKEEIILLSHIAGQLAYGLAGKLFQDNYKRPPNISQPQEHETFNNSLVSLVHCVKSFLLCEKVSLFKIDRNKEYLDCLVSTDPIEAAQVPLNFSIIGLCFTSEKILKLANAKECSMYNKQYEKSYKEVLVVPVGRRGVLVCLNKPKGFNDRDEIKCINFALVANQFLETQIYCQRTWESSKIAYQVCDMCTECSACIDYDGKVIFVNKEFCNVVGKDKESILNQAATDVFAQSEELLAKILKNVTANALEISEVVLAGKKFRGTIHYLQNFLVLLLIKK